MLYQNISFRKIFIHTQNGQSPTNSDILDQLCVASLLTVKTYLPTDVKFTALLNEFRECQPELHKEKLIKVLVCSQTIEPITC